jgi:RNA-directed DNA polymerase
MKNWSDAKNFDAFTAYVNQGIQLLNEERSTRDSVLLPFSSMQVFAISKQVDKLYTSFEIPKKSGAMRQIDAPVFHLKLMQRAIKAMLETALEESPAAHGFVRGRSIHTNAAEHVGQDWVLNLDVVGFFPAIHKGRLQVLLKRDPVEYSPELARFISTICTKDGVLPQGSPASPLLTNLVCLRLDKMLGIVAAQFGAKYTRYADDITFSGTSKAMLCRLLAVVKKVLNSEGFKVHPTKTRILPASQRQEVTGLSVHEFVNVPRVYRRRVRAALHQWEKVGIEETFKKHGYSSARTFVNSLRGQLGFLEHTSKSAERDFSSEYQRFVVKYDYLCGLS